MYVNEREDATFKKVTIESDDVYLSFFENAENAFSSKVNLNFNHVTAYAKRFSTSIVSDFLCVPPLLEERNSLTK